MKRQRVSPVRDITTVSLPPEVWLYIGRLILPLYKDVVYPHDTDDMLQRQQTLGRYVQCCRAFYTGLCDVLASWACEIRCELCHSRRGRIGSNCNQGPYCKFGVLARRNSYDVFCLTCVPSYCTGCSLGNCGCNPLYDQCVKCKDAYCEYCCFDEDRFCYHRGIVGLCARCREKWADDLTPSSSEGEDEAQ